MRSLVIAAGLVVLCAGAGAETLRFEAYQVQPGGRRTLLAKGTREYSPETDIQVVDASTQEHPAHWFKRLALFGPFELEADVYREPTLDGFGLVINERENPNGFSWNWFDREQGDVFVKRRGPGRVKVKVQQSQGNVELAVVEFLDHIVLRYTSDMCEHEPGEHTHELIIMKGSILRVLREEP